MFIVGAFLRPVGCLAPISRERSPLRKPLIASLGHFDWSPAMNIPSNGRTKEKRLNKKTAPKRGSQGLIVETLLVQDNGFDWNPPHCCLIYIEETHG